ncbi:MAG: phosphoglycerol geranylgeranyltransferase [Flavobacteriales bacterium]|jgi:phosphoglycerol geranylgeranyltransferase
MRFDLKTFITERAAKGEKSLAVLIDPDKTKGKELEAMVEVINRTANFILVGGSFVSQEDLENCLDQLEVLTTLPVCLFPGHASQVSEQADAILFLNLVSGRNPEYLIGNQVLAAPAIAKSGIQVLATAYLLINCGTPTAAQYISNTQAIPYAQDGIAAATALAAKFMGQQFVYLDGGSGADKVISESMIQAVKTTTKLPLIIGGGIRSASQAQALLKAGADVIVVGNGAESRADILMEIKELMTS